MNQPVAVALHASRHLLLAGFGRGVYACFGRGPLPWSARSLRAIIGKWSVGAAVCASEEKENPLLERVLGWAEGEGFEPSTGFPL